MRNSRKTLQLLGYVVVATALVALLVICCSASAVWGS
jgi:hypothetical protein